ncbi:hypothetical protein V9T40_004570 [Parthenolecanium corni]|uniref:Uncharacterized protein n=1 Tax=Parthenolecanium corni TaxID=536013 RepID=A0AAN9TSZ3_9HEMI
MRRPSNPYYFRSRFSNIKFTMRKQNVVDCLQQKLMDFAVSFIGQLSQFSPRCRNILPDVTIFGWMSQFSAGCLIFPAVEN